MQWRPEVLHSGGGRHRSRKPVSAAVLGCLLVSGAVGTGIMLRPGDGASAGVPAAAPAPGTGSGSVRPAGAPVPAVDGGRHVDNPYAGAVGYLNPDYAAEVRAAAKAARGRMRATMTRVATYPTAIWLDRTATITGGPGVTRTLRGHLTAAVKTVTAKPVVVTLVLYDLPDRDCTDPTGGGDFRMQDDGLARYQREFIDPVVSVLSDPAFAALRIVTVLEPSALAHLVTDRATPLCAQARSSGSHVRGITYALNALHARPNVYTYLDAANAGRLGRQDDLTAAVQLFADVARGTTAGVGSVDGFATNVGSYVPFNEPLLSDPDRTVGGVRVSSAAFYQDNRAVDEGHYVTALRAGLLRAGLPAGTGILVDTSRDGWGGPGRPRVEPTVANVNLYVDAARVDRRSARSESCNQPGGIGARPVAAPAAGIDAFVWVKPPGLSDGSSYRGGAGAGGTAAGDPRCDPHSGSGAMSGAPGSGLFFPAGFKTLIRNAEPPL